MLSAGSANSPMLTKSTTSSAGGVGIPKSGRSTLMLVIVFVTGFVICSFVGLQMSALGGGNNNVVDNALLFSRSEEDQQPPKLHQLDKKLKENQQQIKKKKQSDDDADSEKSEDKPAAPKKNKPKNADVEASDDESDSSSSKKKRTNDDDSAINENDDDSNKKQNKKKLSDDGGDDNSDDDSSSKKKAKRTSSNDEDDKPSDAEAPPAPKKKKSSSGDDNNSDDDGEKKKVSASSSSETNSGDYTPSTTLYDDNGKKIGRPAPTGVQKTADPPTAEEKELVENFQTVPIQLYRHEVTRCMLSFRIVTGMEGDSTVTRVGTDAEKATLNRHKAFNRRVQCYCNEKFVTIDNFNCMVRVKNPLVFRHPTMAADIFVEDSPFMFEARVDNMRETNDPTESTALLRASKTCPPEGSNSGAKKTTSKKKLAEDSGDDSNSGGDDNDSSSALPECGWKHDFASAAPYEEPIDFTDAPMMFVPSIPYTTNHFHSHLGPAGILQLTATRAAINRFYYDLNAAIDNNDPVAIADGEKKRSIISREANYTRSELDVKLNRLGRPKLINKNRFGFRSPRVTIASRGSCSLIDFKNLAVGHQGSWGPEAGEEDWTREQGLPPSYLGREMIYRHTFEVGVQANYAGAFYWFGRRMGYCLQEMPQTSYAKMEELWINVLKGQIGAIWLQSFRRPHPNYSPTLDGKNAATVYLAEDYMNLCPVSHEEITTARYAGQQMVKMLDLYTNKYGKMKHPEDLIAKGQEVKDADSRVRKCLKVSRDHPTKPNTKEALCVMVVARPFKNQTDRSRGMPFLFEHSVLTALLTPVDPRAFTTTPPSEVKTSWYWSADEQTQNERCNVANPPPDKPKPSVEEMIVSYNARLEHMNYLSGRPPCAVIGPGPLHHFGGIYFAGDPRLFDINKLRRVDMEKHSMVEQYDQIRNSNLFIFEEGAPLTWAYSAPNGSTFIVFYNTNAERMRADGTRVKSYSPMTDYFFHFPEVFGKVRIIFFVVQSGRMPSFSKLREAYDRPWKAESIVVACECNTTRIATYTESRPTCDTTNKDAVRK